MDLTRTGFARGARTVALTPLWAAELLTGAKSFMDNPILGSAALNARGLHAGRVTLAHLLAVSRRRRLAPLLDAADRAAFDRDGFLCKPDFLPVELFATLRREVEVYRGTVRETVQGNTVTRRLALTPATLALLPSVRAALMRPDWRGAVRYAGSFDAEPIHYVQTILSHAKDGPDDPQCALHADTFHPTVKAWLFLTDVAEDEGPFTYVAGSHRMTAARLSWERRMSCGMAEQPDRLTRRGSFRIGADELAGLGLPEATRFPVRANTLVVADTHGFHARGPSVRPTRRVEIWSYGRRNPFLPWAGLDIWSLGSFGALRSPAFWRFGDAVEAMGGKRNVWQAREGVSPFDGA